MAWIIVALYFFIALVIWPLIARADYKKYYESPSESIGFGLFFATLWPLMGVLFVLSYFWEELLPKLFRLD